jgi:hypothetical protein
MHLGEVEYMRGFGGNGRRKRPPGRPRRKWMNIRVGLGEISLGCKNWINLA